MTTNIITEFSSPLKKHPHIVLFEPSEEEEIDVDIAASIRLLETTTDNFDPIEDSDVSNKDVEYPKDKDYCPQDSTFNDSDFIEYGSLIYGEKIPSALEMNPLTADQVKKKNNNNIWILPGSIIVQAKMSIFSEL